MRRVVVFALGLLAGCAQIIGLDEHELSDAGVTTVGDSGSPSTAITPDCTKYCDQAMSVCTKEVGFELYRARANCEAACAAFPHGDPNVNANTLECRMTQLARAVQEHENCLGAGVGGTGIVGDPTSSCGSNCEGYCKLREKVCPDQPIIDCLTKCAALPSLGTISANEDFGSGADTLQCRIAHLTVAAVGQKDNKDSDRQTHCWHSGIRSLQASGESGTCDLGSKAPTPTCADYCRITMAGCTGDLQVYENEQSCVAFCEAALTKGKEPMEDTGNTVRCRRIGAYDALRGVPTSGVCSKAGPASNDCGGKCATYCAAAANVCGDQFKSLYPDPATCLTTCARFPDVTGQIPTTYSVKAAVGDTFACRMLHLTAAKLDARRCDSALAVPTSADNKCK